MAGMRKTLPNDINARDNTDQTPLFEAVASSRLTFSLLWDLLVPTGEVCDAAGRGRPYRRAGLLRNL